MKQLKIGRKNAPEMSFAKQKKSTKMFSLTPPQHVLKSHACSQITLEQSNISNTSQQRNSVYNQGQIYGNCGYGFLIGTPRKTNVDRSCVHGMSGRYYEASNDENMYNISSEASRSSPLGSPNPRGKGKREGLRESSSVPSLGRDTLKRNTEEGNKREVRAPLLQRYFFFHAE